MEFSFEFPFGTINDLKKVFGFHVTNVTLVQWVDSFPKPGRDIWQSWIDIPSQDDDYNLEGVDIHLF
jgi:hypothetical protein